MRGTIQALGLALADYRHEALLSACSVCILAAVLAPLMVLLGVHHGIITAMTQRLLNDPRTLEITPVGSGSYGPAWFAQAGALPETAFIMPQTRSIAATMTLVNPNRSSFSQAVTPMIAAGVDDPLLARWRLPAPGWDGGVSQKAGTAPICRDNDKPAEACPRPTALVVLAESTGRRLAAAAGDLIRGHLDRVYDGRRESASLNLRVLAVLPPEARSSDGVYVPLELLAASEDFRDGRAVPFLDWSGETPDWGRDLGHTLEVYAGHIRDSREYASFRLYARSLDDVTSLWRWFQERNIEVFVRSAEIETVKSLDRAFSVVFSLITGAALFGFCASTAGSALAGVRRKSRSLGLMRLMGFPRSGILLFPVAQSLCTGLLGFVLAFVLYLAVAFSIDRLFAASLPGGEALCVLPALYVLAVLCAVLVLSGLSSLSAAWQATLIEPSEVIREL